MYEVIFKKTYKTKYKNVNIPFLFFLPQLLYLWLKHVFIFNMVNTFSWLCRFLFLEMEEVKNMRPSWLLVNMKA